MRVGHGWVGVALAAALALGGVTAASPAADAAGRASAGIAPMAAPDATVTITGHGWGHGRGMGQWGAYGYSKAGWGYASILDHYYGGTTLAGDAGNPATTVELTRMTALGTIVIGSVLSVNGVPLPAGAVLTQGSGINLQLFTGPGCGGPWTAWGGPIASGLTIADASGNTTVCEAAKMTTYRGAIRSVRSGAAVYTLNVAPMEDYLRGVVPRESPAAWGTTGGLEALKAQSVAARSYTLGSGGRAGSGAQSCDTDACQVYGGFASAPYPAQGQPATWTYLESPITDAAIAATAGQVRRFPTGVIARTEFSSSTGGWTAGGNFTAVQDDGDAISPYHTWSVSTSLAAVGAALGTGAIRSIDVTARDGNGTEGGRVKKVTVVAVSGAVTTFTGNEVRSRLGLRSDWFSISGTSVQAAQAVVRAVYADVLGRVPDSGGLAYWTSVVTATGDGSRAVAPIVLSRERLATLVAGVYQTALHRAPEPGGLEYWIGYLGATQRVADLQVSIFSSAEALQVLGGGDTRTWVAGMYAALLGRPATDSETLYWAQVANAKGRGWVVGYIARSDESGTRRLNAYYQVYLGRSLDPSGLASWLPLMSGTGDFTIPGLIASSPEYWGRAQVRFP